VKSLAQLEILSKDEQIAAFKEALHESGVSSTWRWDDASRVTGHDPRFKVLRSIAEKKLAFNQFIDEQKSKERNEARLRRQQVIINFIDIYIIATRRFPRPA